MNDTCQTCLLGDKIQNICRLSGLRINPEIDYCSHHAKELDRCQICGQMMLPNTATFEIDETTGWHWYCKNCHNLINTCQVCPKAQYCAFEQDPNPMPKVVMKTVRQGNMMMQTQIKNEERVKALCPTCTCWSEETGCKREFNVGCDKKPNIWK